MEQNNKYRKIIIIVGAILAAVVLVLFLAGKLDWLFAEDDITDSSYTTSSSSSYTESGTSGDDKNSTSNDEESGTSSSSETSLSSTKGNSSSSRSESSSSSSTESSASQSSSKVSSTGSDESKPIESTLKFRNKNLLNQHYEKHGKDMGFASAAEYEAAAAKVPYDPEVLHKTEAEDGDDVYYIERTNEFVVVSTDGYLRTYFNPDRGIDYFNRQ